jgi:hypothetical protein
MTTRDSTNALNARITLTMRAARTAAGKWTFEMLIASTQPTPRSSHHDPGRCARQAPPPAARRGTRSLPPGAAASLREGLDETITLQRLGVTGALYRTLRSTNGIENLNGLVAHFVRHVRRWRDGRMLVRWIAAGLQEVRRGFRRLRGHRDLAALIRALGRPPMDNRKEVA